MTPPESMRLVFDDDGPDKLGRRHFTLFWLWDGAHGTLDPTTGLRRCAQCFFTDPAPYIAKGWVVSVISKVTRTVRPEVDITPEE